MNTVFYATLLLIANIIRPSYDPVFETSFFQLVDEKERPCFLDTLSYKIMQNSFTFYLFLFHI